MSSVTLRRFATVPTVFVSISDDPRLADELARALHARGVDVRLSPRPGEARWEGWYGAGCANELRESDAFVALVTYGYDSSTWMAHEASVVTELLSAHGRPAVYLFRMEGRPLAAAFRRLEELAIDLPSDVGHAAAIVVAGLG